MFLEVIAKDLNDIRVINNSRADRIEFCKNLEVGGLTPSLDDIILANQITLKPLHVMIRNNTKDFFFDDYELIKQLEMISVIQKLPNIHGIVIGALNSDYTINEDFLQRVNRVKGNLKITFNRAFDLVKDPISALHVLNKHKIDAVLTSGGSNINTGLEMIKQLVDEKLDIEILIGGGVDRNNIKQCLTVNNHIHLGRAIRTNSSWNSDIVIDEINLFKDLDREQVNEQES
uniref:Copper homeostasis protein cutC homolog n=1 Tax=Mycoplasma feriruminatoris TaxID=1179777 RepID=A0A654IHV5_9MOLU|nr:Copper homeostasis protein CutC [Mycoplasma feriruminatoris]